MNVRALVRDPKQVLADWVVMPDKRVITRKGCTIHFPSRFLEQSLAGIGVECFVLGMIAIQVEGSYAVMRVPANLMASPTNIRKLMVENEEYTLFQFDPGRVVLRTISVVKEPTTPYYIYNEIFSKGNSPWYFTMNDRIAVFNMNERYTGSRVGKYREVTSLLVAHTSRNPENLKEFYRHTIQSPQDVKTRPEAVIAMRDVTNAPTNTLNRLGGSYMISEGLVAAMNNPSTRVDTIEHVMRA
jgi:hypothetical protein